MAHRTDTECPGRVVLTEEQIRVRVRELGAEISRDYAGTSLVVIGILTGAALFVADLVRSITIPVEIDFIAAASYGKQTESSGEVRILKDLGRSVHGRDLLIVEDIVDTGLTLRYLLQMLLARGPASVKSCALLDKPSRRRVEVRADYTGFTIPDTFVVGYGLDHAGLYRNLPYIAELGPQG